jgi:uncharacterized protein YcaQ
VRDSLTIDEARRLALYAQGFGERPSGVSSTQRHLDSVMSRIGLIQIDSVNVLVRSQELPLFARLGEHRRDLIPRAHAGQRLFEYWGHAASHIPVESYGLFRWKMDAARNGAMWGGIADFARANRSFVKKVHAHVAQHGPVAAGDISTRVGPKGSWWDWDEAKIALEYLFWTGDLTARRRENDFARLYDVPERMIPAEYLDKPISTVDDAQRELVRRAVRHLGVGTASDIADYFHLKSSVVAARLRELIASGEVVEVRVDGWDKAGFARSDAKVPGPRHALTTAAALLSPFDSLVWCRPRIARLFSFDYKIEIYTPAAKRRFGYYVLPFLFDGRLVGRFDLKADRQASVLRVQASHIEPAERSASGDIARAAAVELELMASWLGLGSIDVVRRGSLATELRRSVA